VKNTAAPRKHGYLNPLATTRYTLPETRQGYDCCILITENILGLQGALPSKNLFWKILIDEFQIVWLSDETWLASAAIDIK
jgi:hypothetical protein